MFNLSSYLEKFKNLKDPLENKVIISKIILEVVGITLLEKNIIIQKGTVFIQEGALQKNRIYLHKQEILKKINELLPDLRIVEVI